MTARPTVEEAAREMVKALMKITKRLDDQKVHGIDPSQDIEDFANAAIRVETAARAMLAALENTRAYLHADRLPPMSLNGLDNAIAAARKAGISAEVC